VFNRGVDSDSQFDAPSTLPPAPGERRVAPVRVSYALFGTAAAGSLASAPLTLLGGVAPPARLWEAAGLFVALGVLALLGLKVPARRMAAAMTALFMLAAAVLAVVALRLGTGLQSPGLTAYPLLVCVLCAAVGWRPGVALAAVAAPLLLAVWALEPAGAGREVGPVLALGTHLILLAAGLACGTITALVLGRTTDAARDREQRFRALLAVAVDAYWEIDTRYRMVALKWHQGTTAVPVGREYLGHVPWELPRLRCEAEVLDRLQADLDARLPFRDVPAVWAGREGDPDRLLQLSGEPRFDERGVFRGYWGVARDVSADVAARQALAATEARYQELFTRTPSALVLHRAGRVIDANPAALALFGFPTIEAMRGADILPFFEEGDSRDRGRRRLAALEAAPPGGALPVTEYRLRVGGRLLWVRATGVRMDVGGRPAALSIYLDITERLAAEDAVRRSEAMLSHLVATSPDLITLTELDSGRYAMVNAAFERVTGYAAAEVVGRTSLELGVWADPAERQRFTAVLRERGSVADMPLGFVTKDGTVVRLLVSAARFGMDGRDYIVINARDVTETERSRLEREAILQNASIGIAVTRGQRFVLANPAFEQIFGWPAGGLIGQGGRVVWGSDADYADVGAVGGERLARGEPYETERTMCRRDGSRFEARVRARAIDPSRTEHGGTVWIVEDVTERREFERKLARARDDAEAASRAKSAFLANTSHELRTPLNGMIGMAELARAPDTDEVRRRQYLDQIAESAQSLAGIISDILDLSKIEAGKLQLETTAFDLGELLRALQRAYATLALARQLRLVFELGPGIEGAQVLGDPLRVRQILSNFISNALKFTEAGQVRVVARRRTGDARVRLEVQDTGPGIAAEVQGRLFQPFTQADESTTRRFGGTGLGLSICRELASLMDGEVGVTSEPGRGATFWAELPLPPTAPAASAPRDERGQDLAGARVLLVEDNPVNMMIATAMLERWGVQVEPAHDGGQALQAVKRAASVGQPFDAVLMDLQMPVMSGHEAARALRRTEAGRGLPIIALTAAALVSERAEALEAGMDDFLTKPIDAEKLRATLGRWVAPRAPAAGPEAGAGSAVSSG
jgi:PAS domain S-box-containing protein